MLASVVLVAVVAASQPALDDRKFDAKSAQHVGTGAAIGVGAMGTCSTYLDLRKRVKKEKPILGTLGCYSLTVLTSAAAYGYKEGVYDPKKYGDGAVNPKGRRDWVEGVGGAAVGALLFVPVATW